MSTALAPGCSRADCESGARVAIMMPNVPQYLVAIAAVLRAGYTVVNVNPLYTPRELEHQLKDSGAEAIVILENFADHAGTGDRATPRQARGARGDGRPAGLLEGQLVNFVVRHVKKMVPAFTLPLTDGRSVTRFNMALAEGTPAEPASGAASARRRRLPAVHRRHDRRVKGATLLHRNVVANILQTEAWFKPMLDTLGDKPAHRASARCRCTTSSR